MLMNGTFASAASGAMAAALGVQTVPVSDPLGVVRVGSAVVAGDDLDFDAGRQFLAVQLHEQLHPLVQLISLGGGGAGIGADEPDLDGLGQGVSRGRGERQRRGASDHLDAHE